MEPASPENRPPTPTGAPLLVVRLDEAEVVTVSAGDLPAQTTPVVELTRPAQALHFADSGGTVRSYDLSSVFAEGDRFLHMSIRVSTAYAVQADALLTTDGRNAQESFSGGGGRGIRLQPFLLPEFSGWAPDTTGRGLFARGLHYAGLVTPGNVSLLCICDHCRRSFRVQSFHAGFMDVAYLYCSRGPHTLTASAYEDDAPPVLGAADPAAVSRFEARLPPCERCGGEFRYLNPFRCPHCLQPYIDFPSHPQDRAQEYYGNYLYGDTTQRWAPGKPGEPGSHA